MSWSRISTCLKGNFPEYSSLRAGDIEEIYNEVEELHPGWIGEMHGAESNSTEIEELLTLVRSHGLSRRDRFPRDTRSTGAMLAYIDQLVNDKPEVEGPQMMPVVERAQGWEGLVDEEYLAALPEELQEEALMQYAAAASTDEVLHGREGIVDEEYLAALPEELQEEALMQYAAAASTDEALHGREGLVDEEYLAALPEELQEEALMQYAAAASTDEVLHGREGLVDEEYLAALPEELQEEALMQYAAAASTNESLHGWVQ